MTDLKIPSGKEAKILELLSSGNEMFGLEMVRSDVGLNRNTIYVILGRMIERGFITSRTEEDARTPGLPRRLYRVTNVGRQALAARESVKGYFSGALPVGTS